MVRFIALAIGVFPATVAFAQPVDAMRPASDLRGHHSAIQGLAINADGSRVASVGSEDFTFLWDVAARKVQFELGPRGRSLDGAQPVLVGERRVETVAFSPDGALLAEAATERDNAGVVRLWNVASGKVVRTIVENGKNIRPVAFLPDGALLAVNLRDAADGNQITMFNVETGAQAYSLREEKLTPSLLTISSDGKLLAAAGGTKIHVWELESRTRKHVFTHRKEIQGLAFSPDNTLLLAGGGTDPIRLWDLAMGVARREIPHEQKTIESVAYSPTGKSVASGGSGPDPSICIWDPTTGKLLRRLHGHVDKVTALAISADGKTIASGSGAKDTTIGIWDLKETAK